MRRFLLHNPLSIFLFYLVHLFPYILYRVLGH